MSSKGYCLANDIERYLGVTLTALQASQADSLIEAAERRIDAHTGHAWKVGTVTGERVVPSGPWVRLKSTPSTGLTSITGRTHLSSSATTLTAGTDYELLDAAQGLVYLGGTIRNYDYLLVTYGTDNSVPADVSAATAMLVAHYLGPHLNGITSEVASFQAFGQVQVTLRDGPLPPDVVDLLSPYTRGVVIG